MREWSDNGILSHVPANVSLGSGKNSDVGWWFSRIQERYQHCEKNDSGKKRNIGNFKELLRDIFVNVMKFTLNIQ
ncbi:hypothetical protein HHI36_004568, partial [Cryptolaemus montrouzieri]